MNKNIETLIKQLNPSNTKQNEPLSKHTNLKIGGPADIYYESPDTNDFVRVIKLAKHYEIPVTVIGLGSNILVSDDGIRGLVIRNLSKTIKISGKQPVHEDRVEVTPRWESDSSSGTFRGIEFKDLDYDESDKPRVEVIMDSGVDLPFAIKYLIEQGLTGLQWYAGIPGTIGGAIFNNIHGGTHFISEVLSGVKILDKDTEIKDLSIEELGVDYDKSRFHNSGEIILQGVFSLYKGDTERAKHTVAEWSKRKKIQPRNSPGCAFANITQEQKERLGHPTTSAGYIIEHVLKMTGYRVGDAAISPKHHNFIVNEGNAKASDYLSIMKEITKQTKETLGIRLVPEIILLGFKKSEIEEFSSEEQEELRKKRNKDIKTVYRSK